MNIFHREQILDRLRTSAARGIPVVAAGCSCGLVAKCAAQAGADLLVVYSTGLSRLKGLPTSRIGDSNAATLDMVDEIRNVVSSVPIVGGVEAWDPTRLDLSQLLDRFQAAGFSGIINYPTISTMGETWRDRRERVGLGFSREVQLIRLARERDLFSMAYVATPDDAQQMAHVGVDCLVPHVGATSGGLVGHETPSSKVSEVEQLQELIAAARMVRDNIVFLAHGGKFSLPEDLEDVYAQTHCIGFVGASSVERIPVERAVLDAVAQFKRVPPRWHQADGQSGHAQAGTAATAKPSAYESDSGATDRSILVVGTANVDLSLHVRELPNPGETVMGDLTTVCGGKGANQAVTAVRLGANVSIVTRIGEDDNGLALLRALGQEGVRTTGVTKVAGGVSGVALIMVDEGGRTTIGVAEGVNRFMQVGDLDHSAELHDPDTIVLAELGVPLKVIKHLCQLKLQVGFTFILNPAPAVAPLDDSLWGSIDVVTPNATEAEVLTGLSVVDNDSALNATDRLRAFGADLSVVTLGERGIAYNSTQGRGILQAYTVAAVDTTAASDAFNGGLAVALQSGRNHVDALRYGQAVAAISVTRVGAQSSLPTRTEVEEFLAKQPSLREYA